MTDWALNKGHACSYRLALHVHEGSSLLVRCPHLCINDLPVSITMIVWGTRQTIPLQNSPDLDRFKANQGSPSSTPAWNPGGYQEHHSGVARKTGGAVSDWRPQQPLWNLEGIQPPYPHPPQHNQLDPDSQVPDKSHVRVTANFYVHKALFRHIIYSKSTNKRGFTLIRVLVCLPAALWLSCLLNDLQKQLSSDSGCCST